MKQFGFLLILLLCLPIVGQSGYGINTFYVDLDQDEVGFDTFAGKPLVVEAFATWCSHCQAEHKELVELWDNYNDSINLISLSVASDDTLEDIYNYLDDYPSNWTVGWDRDLIFANEFNVEAFPAIILFDSNGNFGSCDIGERSYESMAKDVDALISDPLKYVETNSGDGQCSSTGFFERTPIIVWIGLFLSLSFTIYFIYQEKKKGKKEPTE